MLTFIFRLINIVVAPDSRSYFHFNPLNAELNPIQHLLAVLGAHHILHVSRIRVKCPSLHLTGTVFSLSSINPYF